VASFSPTRSETLEDQKRYLEGHLVEVSCLDCLATVKVRKNSEPHTSIQWTDEAVAHCTEFARRGAERSVMESCPRLKASIETAVRDGALEVGADVD
jgi:hypothetical protein